MEIDSVLFIGTVIAGVTQFIKTLVPINGAITIATAVAVGILVALVDKEIGLKDNISVAAGIMIALGTVGTVTALGKVGNQPPAQTVIGNKKLGKD